MTTEIIAESFLETALKKYKVGEAEIATLSEKCLALKVASVIDKEGYEIVRQAYVGVRSKIIEVEAVRKEEKKESLNFGRAIDARAKTLTELLTPIKEHLFEQKKIVDDEEFRIANEKARLAQEIIEKAEAIKKKEEEEAQAKIRADQKAKSARLEKIRLELEEKEAELIAKEEAIRKEQEEARMEQERQEYEEKEKHRHEEAKREVEEKAKQDAEEKVERDAETKRLAEEQAAKDEALRVALMPDNEKLAALADKIESLEMPSLTHKESCVILDDAKIYLEKAFNVLKQNTK